MVANWVVSLNWEDEITWDKLRTLVDQLVECVLTISTRLTPDYWTSLVVNVLTTLGDIFTV